MNQVKKILSFCKRTNNVEVRLTFQDIDGSSFTRKPDVVKNNENEIFIIFCFDANSKNILEFKKEGVNFEMKCELDYKEETIVVFWYNDDGKEELEDGKLTPRESGNGGVLGFSDLGTC